jgi:predicted NBD/HSP70 family sugar kinase/predicted transcriptional regulator
LSRTDQQDASPQARLRLEHTRAILRAITSQVAVSRTQLAEAHGLSSQSVGRIARELLDDGLIEETDMARAAGPGAPRIGLRIRPDGAYALGFGLERDRLTGVLLDFGGNVRWQMSRSTPKGEPAISTLHRIEDDVRSVLDSADWSDRRDRICGLGIATPGPIDQTTGTIIGAPNFPSWQHVDVAEGLGGDMDLPVVIDNAATAAAIGTKWQTRRGSQPFIYCYWGLGIGGGLIVDDEAYRGTTGNSLELGHVVVAPGGHGCDCGSQGCLEAEASVSAILRDARPHGSFATVQEVVAAAAWSRPLAALLTEAAEKVAIALISAVNLLDVDEVVIGGEHFLAVESLFLPIIRQRLATRLFRRQISLTTVTVSTLGDAANAIGAATLVFHSLLPSSGWRPHGVERSSLAIIRAGRGRRLRSVS